MKRYELAKKQGLNWQVVLVQDAETDIKIMTRDCVLQGLTFSAINDKVVNLIDGIIKELESEEVKKLTKDTLLKFASKVYLQWLKIYGTTDIMVIKYLKTKNVIVNAQAPSKTPDSVYNRAVANGINPQQYEKQINQILDQQSSPDYSDRYSLRAHIERIVRAEYQNKQLEALKGKGVKLVWIDTHANCSKRCQPFQGKLYSLDNTSGTVKGIKYKPLTEATDIYSYTKAGKAYKNGCISGFNCRHKLVPFSDGIKPQTIPSEVLSRQREIETKQRFIERTVRKYEARALGWKGIDKKQYNFYKQLKNKWENRYLEYSKQNNVPIYPSRLKV